MSASHWLLIFCGRWAKIPTIQKANLLKIVKRMFGQISPEFQSQMEKIRSVKTLDALIDFALVCGSLEDFQAKMDELELD